MTLNNKLEQACRHRLCCILAHSLKWKYSRGIAAILLGQVSPHWTERSRFWPSFCRLIPCGHHFWCVLNYQFGLCIEVHLFCTATVCMIGPTAAKRGHSLTKSVDLINFSNHTKLRRWSCCFLDWSNKEPQCTCKHKMCHYENTASDCGSLGVNYRGEELESNVTFFRFIVM